MHKRHGKLSPKTAICDQETGIAWIFDTEDWSDKSTPGADNECWDWKGSINKNGYGMFYVKQITEDFVCYYMTASRLAKAIELGRPLKKEERVIASCQNRACTNPAHLEIGTHKDQYKFFKARKISKKT